MNIYESLYDTGTNSKFRITLVPQKHVTIERIDGGTVVSVKRFEVGAAVEYDSFSLSYIGTITNITAKCVTVKKDSDASFVAFPVPSWLALPPAFCGNLRCIRDRGEEPDVVDG